MKKLYTIEEVAELYGINPDSICLWIKNGVMKAFKCKSNSGGSWEWLIPEEEFVRCNGWPDFIDLRTDDQRMDDVLMVLDLMEEARYDEIDYIVELRQKLERGEL